MSDTGDRAAKVIVLDRQRPDFDQCAWSLRQVLGERVGKGFAKWVVAPERGRFVIWAGVAGFGTERALSFAIDEDELLKVLPIRLKEVHEFTGCKADLQLLVIPELDDRIKREFSPP